MTAAVAGPDRPLREPSAPLRIANYLRIMFPPLVLVPAGLFKFLALYFALQAFSGAQVLALGGRGLAGAVSMVLFLLLFRVYDELKDVESDRRMAAAGDPRYMDRPIVTGAVHTRDLQALKWLIYMLLGTLNVGLGLSALLGFAALFGVLWLSSRWFFWPRIQSDLRLAIVTHNPITIVMQLYVVAVFLGDHAALPEPLLCVALWLGLWLPTTAWEMARKQRVAEDETDYQTYTKLLGRTLSVGLPLAFTVVSAACVLWLTLQAKLGWVYPAVLLVVTALVIGCYVRFLLAPSRKSAHLQPAAEAYLATVDFGLSIALALHFGLEWV